MMACKEFISIEYKLHNYPNENDRLIKSSIFINKRNKKSYHIFYNFKLGKELILFLIIIK